MVLPVEAILARRRGVHAARDDQPPLVLAEPQLDPRLRRPPRLPVRLHRQLRGDIPRRRPRPPLVVTVPDDPRPAEPAGLLDVFERPPLLHRFPGRVGQRQPLDEHEHPPGRPVLHDAVGLAPHRIAAVEHHRGRPRPPMIPAPHQHRIQRPPVIRRPPPLAVLRQHQHRALGRNEHLRYRVRPSGVAFGQHRNLLKERFSRLFQGITPNGCRPNGRSRAAKQQHGADDDLNDANRSHAPPPVSTPHLTRRADGSGSGLPRSAGSREVMRLPRRHNPRKSRHANKLYHARGLAGNNNYAMPPPQTPVGLACQLSPAVS